ncbi:hypothetical protein 162310560 [Organic Lake phycodnavirus]|nr:hypothetical protein 162310560 [Organic Lake phycodnavirus]
MKDVSAQNMYLSGSLDVSGNTTIGGDLSVAGVTAQNMDLSGSLDVSGNTTIGGDLSVADVTAQNMDLSGSLDVSGNTTIGGDLSVADVTTLSSLSVTGNETVGGTLDVTGASTLTGNVGIGGASGSEKLLVTGTGRITGNLDVSGDLTVTGNFNFSEVIQNITTVNNEVIISTQLDISNQGTGPALKVSQFGVGDDQDVALFNAGDEGDAFKIDSSGNSHFYKEVNIVKENDVSFDTILIRRTDATSVYMNLRTLQVYANNINILPSATNATQSFESGSLGDVIEFITWNDLVAESTHTYSGQIFYASNIRNNNISSTYPVHSLDIGYISLYIPLTQSFNISDIQSFVLYNRFDNHQGRINGFEIELYNRSNGFTPGTNVLYSMPINTTAYVYRFDLPAIDTYTGGFTSTDSQTQIKDITVSTSTQNFDTTLLKVEGGNTELGGDLSVSGTTTTGNVDITRTLVVSGNETLKNIDQFDTIVIRKPSGYIILWELQCWVNNKNILYDNSSSLVSYFSYWNTSGGTGDVGELGSNVASSSYNNTLNDQAHGNNNVTSLIIKNIPLTTCFDVQSIVYYNRNNKGNYILGTYIELYNSNDYSTPLVQTPTINNRNAIYRFDFPMLNSYTAGYSTSPSTTQIIATNATISSIYSYISGIVRYPVFFFNSETGNIIMEGTLQVNRIKGNSYEGNISIVFNSVDNLHFFNNSTNSSVGYIEDDGNVSQIDFTGQHRCFIKDLPFSNTDVYEGRIVCADQNTNITISGSIKKGNQAITQNETLPYVSLSVKNNDKSCFGVISASEDPNERVDRYGSFCTPFEKEKGDTRVYINSLGEGAIWVSNKNGELESGDYITTCDLLGYGVKQDDDVLHNYTVAKITMDCDFNPRYVPRPTIMKDAGGENILDPYEQIQWTDEEDASET